MAKNQIISIPDRDYSFVVLTQGQVAVVDNADLSLIAEYKWWASFTARDRKYRAVSHVMRGKKKTQIYMHQMIMGTPEGLETDHIHHHTLDNRRSNLRVCTHGQNMMNQRARAGSASGYKGVYPVPRYPGKFRAIIHANKESYHLGTFNDSRDAAIAYNYAATRLHGEFACLNSLNPSINA